MEGGREWKERMERESRGRVEGVVRGRERMGREGVGRWRVREREMDGGGNMMGHTELTYIT